MFSENFYQTPIQDLICVIVNARFNVSLKWFVCLDIEFDSPDSVESVTISLGSNLDGLVSDKSHRYTDVDFGICV